MRAGLLPDVLCTTTTCSEVSTTCAAGAAPDEGLAEAIDLVESKRDADGRWHVKNLHPGWLHFAMDEGEGRPSRWNTLRAMWVLRCTRNHLTRPPHEGGREPARQRRFESTPAHHYAFL